MTAAEIKHQLTLAREFLEANGYYVCRIAEAEAVPPESLPVLLFDADGPTLMSMGQVNARAG